MMAAGPAATEALRAPKSHPEPMMEPTLAKSSPTTPTWRLSLVCSPASDCVSVDMTTRLSRPPAPCMERLSRRRFLLYPGSRAPKPAAESLRKASLRAMMDR